MSSPMPKCSTSAVRRATRSPPVRVSSAVTLAVDADAALRLTEALADDELEIAWSTGAVPTEPPGDDDA